MIRTKMRVLLCVFLFVFAQTGQGQDYKEYEAVARYKNKLEFDQNYHGAVTFANIMPNSFGEPSLREPRDDDVSLELLKAPKGSRILANDPNIAKRYTRPSPKEEMLIERYANPPPEANETMLKWYDLAPMQARNATRPNMQQFIAKKKAPVLRPAEPSSAPGEETAYFPRQSFTLSKPEELPLNWTTCDQFAVGAIFAPIHVINVKWTPFYIWDTQEMRGDAPAIEHTFEYPTSKLVNEYRLKFSKMVNETIDWTRAKLLMKGITETLLIATDKRGLFHAIVKPDIPDSALTLNIKLPSLTLRLKVENPYLLMTFCEEYYATVMAVSGNEPTDVSEMINEAATVKFIGPGRPVWRNFEAEKEKRKAEKDAKIREENEKLELIRDRRLLDQSNGYGTTDTWRT